MPDEEGREVAEARWLDDALAGLAENFCRSAPPCADCVAHVSRVVEAVRKDERKRVHAEMREAAKPKLGPGGHLSGPAGITYAVAGTRVPGAAPGLPFPIERAAPAEGGTKG